MPGISYKSEKVSDDTSSGDRIPGNDSQFKGNDYCSSTKKATINKTDVSGYVSESRDNSFRVNIGVGSPNINNFGHSPSKTPLSLSPTATNSDTEEKWLLVKSSDTEQRILIGASLVGEKRRNIQWKDLNSTSSSSSFTERFFAHRLGAVWEGMKTEGKWTQHERRMHINKLELLALKLGQETFLKA